MNKPFVLTIAATAMLALSGAAHAGNAHRGHSGYGYYGGHAPHHYNRHYGYRDNYRHRRHRRSGISDGVKIVAGALVLGTIIHAISSQNRQTTRTVRTTEVPDYWYRIDGEGRCVQVTLNREGREVWTDVDPGYCR